MDSQSMDIENTPPSTGTTAIDTSSPTPAEIIAERVSGQDPTPTMSENRRKLDDILVKQSCPPMSLKDFMNYLLNVEKGAENLYIVLWLLDYTKRFDQADDLVKALARPWTDADHQAALLVYERAKSNTTVVVGHSTGQGAAVSGIFEAQLSALNEALVPVGLPFRDEILRIARDYIEDDGARTLNVSGRDRHMLYAALAVTTHPSVFARIVEVAKEDLLKGPLPKFIKASKENANSERKMFAISLGISIIVAGIAVFILLALSGLPRLWRFMTALLFIPGGATLYCAMEGMCVVLHGLGHYQIRPWDLFAIVDEPKIDFLKDFFGPIEQEQPWRRRYATVSWIRKVFGKESVVEEPGVRKMQKEEFGAALFFSFVGTTLMLIIFTFCIPEGKGLRSYP